MSKAHEVSPPPSYADSQRMDLRDRPKISTQAIDATAPAESRFLLTREGGLARRDPPWDLIESVVRGLDPGVGTSFCCLKHRSGSYVQALRGLNGFHLERRIYGDAGSRDYVHERACYPNESSARERLVKVDCANSGEKRDLIYCDDVVDAFRDFHAGRINGGWLYWRRLEI